MSNESPGAAANSPPETPGLATHWLDSSANVRLLWRGFLVVLAITVVAEFLITLHPHFEIESWPAFNAWFGFIGCTLMVAVAKLLAVWLKRDDRYYSDENSTMSGDND